MMRNSMEASLDMEPRRDGYEYPYEVITLLIAIMLITTTRFVFQDYNFRTSQFRTQTLRCVYPCYVHYESLVKIWRPAGHSDSGTASLQSLKSTVCLRGIAYANFTFLNTHRQLMNAQQRRFDKFLIFPINSFSMRREFCHYHDRRWSKKHTLFP
jgi:hypothetical protein